MVVFPLPLLSRRHGKKLYRVARFDRLSDRFDRLSDRFDRLSDQLRKKF